VILSQNSAQPAPFALFTPDVSVPSHGPQQPISSPQCAVCILDVTTGRFNVPARKCAACIPDAFAGPSTAFALTPFPAHPYKCPLPQTLLFDTLTNARGVGGCARSFALFLSLFASRVFHNSFPIRRFRTLSKNCRGVGRCHLARSERLGVSPNNSHSGTHTMPHHLVRSPMFRVFDSSTLRPFDSWTPRLPPLVELSNRPPRTSLQAPAQSRPGGNPL
jgi:hypothetical protein